MPISALPAPLITLFTSAKSRLIRPGVVIRSVMPCTPESSTWSAWRNASIMLMLRSPRASSRSLGITMSVSHCWRSSSMPVSACTWRRLPSNENGRVTTPMVSAPILRAMLATTGAPPVPVPPPSPQVTKHHVGAAQDLLDLVAVVLGGVAADVGVGPGAEAAGQLPADVELDVGVAHQQRLRIGVDGDELDALEPDLDHAVDGIHAATADADHLDDRQVVVRRCHQCFPFEPGGGRFTAGQPVRGHGPQ